MEQFCATLNFIDKRHDFEPLDPKEPKMTDKHASVASPEEFRNGIEELSTDIIVKIRQITTLIDSLPGVSVSAEEQLHKIDSLQKKLVEVEDEKIKAVQRKDKLLKEVDDLISVFVSGIADSKRNPVPNSSGPSPTSNNDNNVNSNDDRDNIAPVEPKQEQNEVIIEQPVEVENQQQGESKQEGTDIKEETADKDQMDDNVLDSMMDDNVEEGQDFGLEDI